MHELEPGHRLPPMEVVPTNGNGNGNGNGYPSRALASRMTNVEMPGPGLKRDYAGVLEYWQMIRRHKFLVASITVLGALIGFLVTVPEPRIYQARATLEIQGLNSDFMNMRNVNPTMTATSNEYPDYDIQTQVRIIQSRSLVEKVVKKMEMEKKLDNLVPPDRLAAWRKALRLSPPSPEALWRQALDTAAGGVRVRSAGTNRIVEVSTDSTSPHVAADFVNMLAQEYIEDSLESRWQSTEHTGEFLTKQLEDLKIKLERSQDELQAYAKATNLVFTGEGNELTNVNDARLVQLQKELTEASADRVSKQSRFEMASMSQPDALPDVLDNPGLREIQKQMTDLRGKLAQLKVTFTPNHPDVRKAQAELSTLETALDMERNNILTRIRNEYIAAQRRENLLSSTYAGQAGAVSQDAAKSAHYLLLKRDVDANRTLYESMLQRLKEASIASALRASNIRVVDAAISPGVPYKPNVTQRVIVGLLSGIFLAVVLVVFRERADRTLQDPGDPAYFLSVPELGVIPSADPKGGIAGSKRVNPSLALATQGETGGRVELITWAQKSSLLAESFRTVLTSILFAGEHESKPKVLVLTSSSPKEGKTTVVCNLAIAVAEINNRVLIVDGDMRRPRIHSVFDAKNDKGLSDLLISRTPLDDETVKDAIQETLVPGLSVMTSGSVRHGISGLLHSPRLPELMNRLRSQFDMVIVDTPPMVNISDARILARLADGLILVLRSSFTTRDAALLAKRRFAEDGLHIMGTILNNWNPNTPGYSYYRYYYAGYQHYYGGNDGHEEEMALGGDRKS